MQRPRTNIDIGRNPNILGLPFIDGIIILASTALIILISSFSRTWGLLLFIPIIVIYIKIKNKNKAKMKGHLTYFFNANRAIDIIKINSHD